MFFKPKAELSQGTSQPGKIILLCGTSTAGKTSISIAAQAEANKTGHALILDGADMAAEKAWTEPSEFGGKKYLSAQDHFVEAMKQYSNPAIVDAAVEHFGARTLAVALFSRRNLGNPKVDQVDLTPEGDIKAQAAKVYEALSNENKQQYTAEGIEGLLRIIRDSPDVGAFFAQHPYPPLQQLNLIMLERAIARAEKGESTILDIVGNETIDDKHKMVDIFHEQLKSKGLSAEAGIVAIAHCPVETLIHRIDERNRKAMAEGRKEDIRLAFFPFEQYGALYEKTPDRSDPTRPIVGMVTREDVTTAARQFGRGEVDATSLLAKLGFADGEERISVVPRIQCDELLQTGSHSSQELAERLCKKAFENTFTSNHKKNF